MSKAICMVAIMDPNYIVGACIACYRHKQFIKKLGLDIDVVIMIDPSLRHYKRDLEIYFDRVYHIDLMGIRLYGDYSSAEMYSINKWQSMKLEEYEKVLYVNVDVMPMDEHFYDVFGFKTPAVMFKNLDLDENQPINPHMIIQMNDPREYSNPKFILNQAMMGSIFLFRPSMKLFLKYVSFLRLCEGTYGFIGLPHSTPDESTMTIFLFAFIQKPIFDIPYRFAPVPWDTHLNQFHPSALTFESRINPWVKIPLVQYPPENIWHLIASKALPMSKDITKLYMEALMKQTKRFYFDMDHNMVVQNPPYNMQAVLNPRTRHQSIQLLRNVASHQRLDSKDLMKFLSKTRKLSKKLD